VPSEGPSARSPSRLGKNSPLNTPTSSAASNAITRVAAVRRVLVIVLALNVVVLIAKLVIALRTGALAVLGATLDSGLDALSSLMGLLLVTVATKGPDEEHPYGHGKFETLGTLGIVGFLSISCFELFRAGLVALVTGSAPREQSAIDIAVLGLTLIVNGFIAWYERRVGRSLSSAFLVADAAHTRGDLLVTVLAILSLALSQIGFGRIDGALGIAVASIIGWSGVQILKQSVPVLVDARAVETSELAAVVRRVPLVAEVRSARSRSTASGQLFADVTIAVDGSLSVERAHELADAVEQAVEAAFGAAEVTVHVEPS
jgi:cation diffusion facilitator family transporter